jgi:hypothetical protein
MEVLDFYGPHDAGTMAGFRTEGIGRYLTNSETDPRQITPQEVADAHALGLAVHFFYEMNPTYPSYFTFAQGVEDCRQAKARLAWLGAPNGTVVYFTVDTNQVDGPMVAEYFNGIASEQTAQIVPGLYGYQRVCEHAYAHFPNVGKHLWQTYGRGTVPLEGWQYLQEDRAGVSVDVNDVSAPGWTGDDMTSDEVTAIVKNYIATVYGPALEVQLRQAHSQTVADAVAATAAKLAG